ncbi:hypothetical protein ACUM5Y_10175 [Marinomonas dokdonensis]|uniref:hypothetical protein n=1 Tax=Marinomonas dokdonensis TaxID=328224 RepID=UPI0040553992
MYQRLNALHRILITSLTLCLSMPLWAAVGSLEFRLGPYISNIEYEEPGFMKEKGSLSGLAGRITLYESLAMMSLEVDYADGKMDYNGSGRIDGIPNTFLETRGLLGRSVLLDEAKLLTIFIGFGYRNLNDDSSGLVSSTGHYGYERKQIYYYVPIGIEFKNRLNSSDWRVNGRAEYDNFFYGRNTSYLGTISGYSDVELEQNYGHGYRFSLEFEKPLSAQGGAIVVNPFYRHWNIEKSQVTYNSRGGWYEPKNTSDEYGVAVFLSF